MNNEIKRDIEYLCVCAEVYADKLPVPAHMKRLVSRVRSYLAAHEPQGVQTGTNRV